MRLEAAGVIGLLEASYRVEQPAAAWLAGLLSAFRGLVDSGRGWCGYFVDASGPEFRDWGYQSVGRWRLGKRGFRRWRDRTPIGVKKFIHLHAPCNYGSQIRPPPALLEGLDGTWGHHGEAELFGLNALDAAGRGVALVATFPALQRTLPPQTAQIFYRLAAHVAAGARILTALGERPKADALIDNAAAIVSPRGRIEHASGSATERGSREALRDAAIRIDRARTRHARIDDAEVTQSWQALVAGRFTLVDRFERDGRRYFVARNNRPGVAAGAQLTQREAEVAGAASLGHSNKMIAYELGISPSSVATHLRRAALKLGAGSRVELISAYAASIR